MSVAAGDSPDVELETPAQRLVAEYAAASYEATAQIEMAKRRLALLKQQIAEALPAAAKDLTEAERIALLGAHYWDSLELDVSVVARALGFRSMNTVISKMPSGSTGIVCARCGVELLADSKTELVQIRSAARQSEKKGRSPPICDACWQRRSVAWDREREQAAAAVQARLTGLRTMPYRQYLRTSEWQETRAKALKRSRYRCQLCGAAQWVTLDVHHSTYERRGQELPADLIVLCRPCHGKHHTELPQVPS